MQQSADSHIRDVASVAIQFRMLWMFYRTRRQCIKPLPLKTVVVIQVSTMMTTIADESLVHNVRGKEGY